MTETTESTILRKYYKEKDFISSTDGVLKVLSVILCIIVSVLAMWTQTACSRAPPLAYSAGAMALASAAVLALLTAAALLAAPIRAPMLWLYTDIITSSVVGVQLVVTVILAVIFCKRDSAIVFFYFVLVVLTVGTSVGSAALGYRAAMKRVDAARPAAEATRPQPTEQDA